MFGAPSEPDPQAWQVSGAVARSNGLREVWPAPLDDAFRRRFRFAAPRPAAPIVPRRISFTVHMFGQGGTDRVCAHLANGFAAAGHDVEIIAFCRSGDAEDALLALIGPGVKLVFLGPRTGSRPRDLATRLPAFIGHLRKRAPASVISTGNNMNWITAIGVDLARLRNCRLVMKTTNPIVRPNEPVVKRHFRRLGYAAAFRRADLVLTLSEPETVGLRAAFPEVADRFVTVANPYVTAAMLAPARPYAIPRASGERLILGVGRFGPQKRMDLLLHALAKVKTPNTRLVLLGDGPARGELERLTVTLGLAGSVAFPGFVNNVADWFALADLFVLPSVYEGLPAVVVEAMAANCPVVATDCFAAARRLVGDAPGCVLLDGCDPDELAALIDAVLAKPRPTGLKAVAARYSIDRAVAEHLAALGRLFPATALAIA